MTQPASFLPRPRHTVHWPRVEVIKHQVKVKSTTIISTQEVASKFFTALSASVCHNILRLMTHSWTVLYVQNILDAPRHHLELQRLKKIASGN